ncbi:hypothetical protein PP459_gp120 [Streptomyces phage Wakanda]|uniref:Uncharacterized protein n=2 Tax=Wakandavirus TaxID=3044854 RepID=A0A6G8R3Z7_9CAUD|nr:hypothetical protein PP459_gp120 [Streptomyces phage Wakanda]YP_010652434.1 hypothetical protein PP460_gp124 [Streptomyces phage Muntaha]QIN94113.1 hypothetical protein SEA_WAKANDA_146 [Streptomyces phage Wakanda]QIN94678.1 hypothetical protein SEA_MUNTAHA_147 [Streptomyces phage Muntaha]
MFRLRFVRNTAVHPMDVVEGILSLAVLLHGLWLISPYFVTSASVGSLILDGDSLFPRVIGLSQAVVSGLHLYTLIKKPREWEVIRRGASFFTFTLYLFYGSSSLILYGLGRVTWITTFALAFISGVVYLRLKWEVSRSARD